VSFYRQPRGACVEILACRRYLRERNFSGRYTGIDLMPELIATGKKAYPAADLRISDMAIFPATETFDLVVLLGFSALGSITDNWQQITDTLD
jgi:trans-aconitate methyltransferase